MASAQERLSRPHVSARVIDAQSWIVRDGTSATLRHGPAPRATTGGWVRQLAHRLVQALHAAERQGRSRA